VVSSVVACVVGARMFFATRMFLVQRGFGQNKNVIYIYIYIPECSKIPDAQKYRTS